MWSRAPAGTSGVASGGDRSGRYADPVIRATDRRRSLRDRQHKHGPWGVPTRRPTRSERAATRYATVLREDGARLRIRWGALLADDRAPLRTIVTDLDRAQVRFEVGDDVVFTTRDGSTMPGTIEKLNPKRARVRCAQQRWDVPYVVLRHRDEPDRGRAGERLGEVAKEARALMDAHGLEAWTLRFGAAR